MTNDEIRIKMQAVNARMLDLSEGRYDITNVSIELLRCFQHIASIDALAQTLVNVLEGGEV